MRSAAPKQLMILGGGRNTLGFTRIIGVTSPDNKSSVRLLEKIGLKFERMVQMAEGEREIQLFASDA